jgi:predicted RNA-binding protein with PUA-like domain
MVDMLTYLAARNHMRAMKKGDLAFFYHSNCKVPGIAGVMEIVKEHSIDGTPPIIRGLNVY